MMNRLLTILLATGLASCTTTKITTYEHKDLVGKGTSSPKLGEVSTSEIGDNLYSEFIGTVYSVKTVTIQADATGRITYDADKQDFTIPRGSKTKQLAGVAEKTVNIACYDNVVDFKATGVTAGSINLWSSASNDEICLADYDENNIFESASLKVFIAGLSKQKQDKIVTLDSEVPYKLDTEYSYDLAALNFQRIILYQGHSNGSIKISYRELQGGIARPAFTQDVTYELNQDGGALIAFKGARIEVLKADNESITYKVLEPFRDSILR